MNLSPIPWFRASFVPLIHYHSENLEYTPVPYSISESLRRQGHVRGLVVYNDGASGLSPHTTPRLQSRRRVLMKPRPHSR